VKGENNPSSHEMPINRELPSRLVKGEGQNRVCSDILTVIANCQSIGQLAVYCLTVCCPSSDSLLSFGVSCSIFRS